MNEARAYNMYLDAKFRAIEDAANGEIDALTDAEVERIHASQAAIDALESGLSMQDVLALA